MPGSMRSKPRYVYVDSAAGPPTLCRKIGQLVCLHFSAWVGVDLRSCVISSESSCPLRTGDRPVSAGVDLGSFLFNMPFASPLLCCIVTKGCKCEDGLVSCFLEKVSAFSYRRSADPALTRDAKVGPQNMVQNP